MILQVFNVLQRMEAFKSIEIQLKQNDFDKFSNKIGSLSIKDFDEAC